MRPSSRPKSACRIRWAARCWVCLSCLILSGCQDSGVSQDGGKDLQEISLQLNWFPEAEHGGFFAAQAAGYFREEKLNVRLLPGGPGAPVIQQVATGRVEFAVANADQVLLGRQQQAPVVALMAAMQDSPRCIMVHAESSFHSVLDLDDITLAVGAGKPFAQVLLKRLGDHRLTIVPYQGNVTSFLQRKDYAQQAYVFSEPYVAERQGASTRCLMVSETGYNPYTGLLVTSDRLADTRPELVQGMVRACRRGWQAYLADPGPANQAIAAVNEQMSTEILDFGARAIGPLCRVDDREREAPGHMTANRWKALAIQLAQVGLLEDPTVWQRAFRLDFLDRAPPDVE